MAGNTIGETFRVTTWGESHGPALGAIVDGCPAGLKITQADIQQVLDRRRPGGNVASTTRAELDKVEILSGIFEGRTTGTPISLLIRNSDARSSSYDELKEVFRPGQGDLTYLEKYGIRDWRGGGRASGRETAARVAAGAIAEKLIGAAGIKILAYTQAIGGIAVSSDKIAKVRDLRRKVRSNILFCPDVEAAAAMERRLVEVRGEGDSVGGIVGIIVRGCPAGLGEPVFDKMDADLSKALMSIGSVKAVEIGDGYAVAGLLGSQVNDQMGVLKADGRGKLPGYSVSSKGSAVKGMMFVGYKSNHAGGILAGITNGEDIVLRAYCKPVPSIAKTQQTLDTKRKLKNIEIAGRHDVCVLPRVVPVCEAMVGIVLADHLLRQRAAKI